MKRADKNWFSVIECENYPGENCISISMRVQDILIIGVATEKETGRKKDGNKLDNSSFKSILL